MFIGSATYRSTIEEMLESGFDLRMAVAFWGNRAEDLLFSAGNKHVRIICNLAMGGTNPAAIRRLMERKNVTIRQLDELHAKVIASGHMAIVGSANISTNGLNHEADEDPGWEEAGLVTRDAEALQAIETWFSSLWNRAGEITEEHLQDAEQVWSSRRSNRSTTAPGVPLLQRGSQFFHDRPVYVLIYKENASKEALAAFGDVTAQADSENTAEVRYSVCDLDFFEQQEALPRDSWLIAVRIGPRGGLNIGDVLYRPIPALDMAFTDSQGCEQWVRIVFKSRTLLGTSFNREARHLLRNLATRNLQAIQRFHDRAEWIIPLHELLALDEHTDQSSI